MHPGMKRAYFLTSVVVPVVSVVGQTACSVTGTGAFTSYTDLVLKAFYSGNPTSVPIYVKNVLTVPHTGYDILPEFAPNLSPVIGRKVNGIY